MTTVQEHINALLAIMVDTATIEQVEAGWDHFHAVEAEVERYWSDDTSVVDAMRRTKSGLSTFTQHIRERAPSPYNGWRPNLGSLARKLRGKFDENGDPRW